MWLIDKIFRSKKEQRTTFRNPAKWFVDFLTGGSESISGEHVNEDNALQYTPFWAAVRIISGTLAALPFKVYMSLDNGGKQPTKEHRVYPLIHDRVNEYIDAITFIETRQNHVLTYGNGYAEIQRDGAGRPVALWPLLPDKTKRVLDDQQRPVYELTLPKGDKTYLPDYKVLHIKGLGFDGFTGYNVVRYHKDAIGYGKAVKKFGAKFFANDASPGGVLEHPAALSKDVKDYLKASWNEAHRGLSNAHRIQILEEGMKYNKIGIDPAQAQALEVQKWNVDDCSRIFQIPPHKLGSMEFSKYNNVEQLQIDFVTTTMLYWFRKWESEINYKLFGPKERGKYFAEILVDGLLRGDVKSRTEALAMQKDRGVLSRNEWRAIENRNPVPGGDEMEPAANLMGKSESESSRIRASHLSLVASQWTRVLKKSNGNIENNRRQAANILLEPVLAYASIHNRSESARADLDKLLAELINDNNKWTEYDSVRLAELTLNRIGGNPNGK